MELKYLKDLRGTCSNTSPTINSILEFIERGFHRHIFTRFLDPSWLYRLRIIISHIKEHLEFHLTDFAFIMLGVNVIYAR